MQNLKQVAESTALANHNRVLADKDCKIATAEQNTLFLWGEVYNTPEWKKEYGYNANNYCVMKLIGDNKPEIILGGDGNDQHFGTAATEVALNYILKKTGLRIFQKLPEQITKRKKQGGFAPLPIFFKDRKRREKIINLMLDSRISRELFNRKFMEKYLASFNKSFEKKPNYFWYQQIMSFRMLNLIALVIWWEIIIERNNIKRLNDL